MKVELRKGARVLVARKVDREGTGYWASSMDHEVGAIGTVCEGPDHFGRYSVDTGGTCIWFYHRDCLEFKDVGAFLINGTTYKYDTLEAAEAGVKAIGNHGVTYDIAQLVKRVTVKRETVVTLEEV